MLDKSIRNTALLGTDRKKLNVNDLHPYLAQRLYQNDTQEQLLLDAISYDYYKGVNGQLPSQIENNKLSDPIAEDRNYIPIALSSLLIDVLTEKHHIARPMTQEILEFIVREKQILRPEATLALLPKNFISEKNFRPLVMDVIGKRGEKLFDLFPQLTFTAEKPLKWEEGSTADRLKLFEQWRKSEEAETLISIEKLEKDWPSEGIRTKLSFLKIITRTLKDTDSTFLSSIYEESYNDKKITRKTDKECKKQLISALTRLGKLTILEELKTALLPYLTESKSKKILGIGLGKKKKVFKILKKTDKFWDGEHLSNWLGLSDKNLDLARFDYDPLYWLAEIIEILPFSFWSDLLERDTEEVVKYFLNDKQFQVRITGEKEPIFLPGLIRNAQLTGNKELLEALSKSKYQEEDSKTLITLFSDDQFETYIKENKLWDELPLISARLKETQNRWSKKFSETYLTELQRAIANGDCYPEQNFGALLTGVINPAALPYLKTIHDKVLYESWFNIWNTGVTKPIIRKINLTLRFRKIQKEKYEYS